LPTHTDDSGFVSLNLSFFFSRHSYASILASGDAAVPDPRSPRSLLGEATERLPTGHFRTVLSKI
jgi:hypothetical protein